MTQNLPPHIDASIRALGVIPRQHTPIYKPKPDLCKAWKPTPDDKECPF